MTKYTLYVGLNDKDTHVQKISVLEAAKMVMNIVLSHTDGATIYEADGIYKHDDGTVVVEKSLKVELLFIERKAVTAIVDLIKTVLNQESVIIQTSEIVSELA